MQANEAPAGQQPRILISSGYNKAAQILVLLIVLVVPSMVIYALMFMFNLMSKWLHGISCCE